MDIFKAVFVWNSKQQNSFRSHGINRRNIGARHVEFGMKIDHSDTYIERMKCYSLGNSRRSGNRVSV
jgi:hypothetical protein